MDALSERRLFVFPSWDRSALCLRSLMVMFNDFRVIL